MLVRTQLQDGEILKALTGDMADDKIIIGPIMYEASMVLDLDDEPLCMFGIFTNARHPSGLLLIQEFVARTEDATSSSRKRLVRRLKRLGLKVSDCKTYDDVKDAARSFWPYLSAVIAKAEATGVKAPSPLRVGAMRGAAIQ
jgi:hypothetical protein